MRELKFRTYDLLKRRYDEMPEMYVTTDGHLEPSGNRIAEQYTGLKDKNDKEIYEGDIVKIYLKNKLDGVYVCLWDNLNGEYTWSKTTDPDDADWGGFPMHVKFRIIGNINDNPELLEEKS